MKKGLFWVIIVILIGVFLYSAWSLGGYIVDSIRNSATYGDLQEILEQNRPTRPMPQDPTEPVGPTSPDETAPVQETTPSELVTVTDPESGLQIQMLPEFAQLYVLNTDLVGWIEIPDSNVSYPVVQHPESVDYYLRRDFYGEYATHGCIYVEESANVFTPSDNLTIYGHRMQDGSMFYDLLKYKEKDYYDEHRYILFDTLTERHTYEIVTIFQTTATLNEGFSYHHFIDADNEADFDDFVDTCQSLAFYDTGVDAVYGDKLISLSTCDYDITNGRLVVLAKRIY